MRAFLLCLLLAVTAAAESLTFRPGDISASVKGTLVADQSREYIFHGEAGQQFELAATSARGQWLIVQVRDHNGELVFNNFDSEKLEVSGVLPNSGDYTVSLALRRPEVQREGRLEYLLTLTLHKTRNVPIAGGQGQYFVSDGAGTRPVRGVSVGLGSGGEVVIELSLEGDGFTIKGTYQKENDEATTLKLTEAFGQKIQGQGVVLFDDEIVDGGKPTHVFLRFDAPEQNTHHTLFYGDD